MSFNDHTKYFEDHEFRDEESVLSFFETEELKLCNDAEKKLFRAACCTGKLQVILDGLDEVCPESEPQMLEMIGLVGKMKTFGFYISTRPELKRILEEKLQNFCHQFKPFSETDQIEFLIKFWCKHRQGIFSVDELRTVAEKVVLLVNEKNLSELTGIPLIMKMAAEIFDSNLIAKFVLEDSVVDSTIFKLSNIYETFVGKKIERYLTEKLRLDLSIKRNRKIAESEKRNLMNLYMKMSQKLIMPQIFYENFEFTQDELEEMRKCGLVLSTSELKFIHRTIAEYFVSLTVQEKFINEKIAKFVVEEILYEDKFRLIRNFLNDFIVKFDSGLEVYGKILVECRVECKHLVKMACRENNSEIITYIFKSLFTLRSKSARDLVIEILEGDFTYFYIKEVNDNLNILNLVQKELGLETLQNLVLSKESVFRSLAKNPVNCHLFLLMIRQMSDDSEFWEEFEKNLFFILMVSCLQENFCKENLYQILHEISQIEIEKNIYCFESINARYLHINWQLWNSKTVTNFFLFLIEVKGFKTFFNVMFAIKKNQNKSYKLYQYLVDFLSKLLMSNKFSLKNKLLDSIEKIAFRQLLTKSNRQKQNCFKEIFEKLIVDKLKVNFSEEDLIELRNFPKIFAGVKDAGENVEVIDGFVLTSLSSLYFYRNCSDPQIILSFFQFFLNGSDFDRISTLR